ncbi:acyl-CoA thioesterase [Lacticaseibacillus sp. GG6-2]
MLMSETKAITTHRIFQGQMNEHDSLFGGQTLAWLDESASIAAHRLARRELVTGSVDSMVYLKPVSLGHALMYLSVVTGVGHKSLEVFTKMVGENLDTGERYLAGYAFSTFVSTTDKPLPSLEPDDEESASLHAGYDQRRQANKARRQLVPKVSL